MYEIVRRYTPDIEEYSIDECFANLTGMRRVNKMSYESMAIHIKHDLDTELGMTFSIGLSVNKVLAKVGSKWKKPSGLTIISARDIEKYISVLPVGKVWGIGPNTSAYLNKFGIMTAGDFAKKDTVWVREHLSKPFQEIHAELNGSFIYPLNIGEKHDYASISKTKTFTPPSSNKEYIFSQLSKNVENACIKLRRHDLYTDRCAFFLKTQDFHYNSLEIILSHTTCIPQDILSIIREKFYLVYKPNILYRATGIVLMNLSHNYTQTIDLFGNYLKADKIKKIYDAVDNISHKYGKHSIFVGSSLTALRTPAHSGPRGVSSERNKNILKGETDRKRIGIPFLGKVF
jgi:DNA polymerase-4/DNA polymerase V